MSSGLHISLNAETLFHIGSLPISNSMLTSTLVSLILLVFAIIVRIKLDKKTIKPTGIQNFAELIVESLFGIVNSVTDDLKKSRLFLPSLATFFIFIVLNNWLGLLPGVGSIGINKQESTIISETVTEVPTAEIESKHTDQQEVIDMQKSLEEPSFQETTETVIEEEIESRTTFAPILRPGTADLNTTLALALVSVFSIQFFGLKFLKFSYLKKFINFSNPIACFVGVLEIISEFAKIVSFAFRLFGNIFAGEVLLVVIAYLTRIIAPVPFYGLEVFVGFIQALVFTMLSLVFYNIATAKSH